MRRTLQIGILALAILAAFPFGAAAEFAGLDVNGDTLCGPEDVLVDATAGDVGTTKSFSLYFGETPADLFAFGCSFCISDSTKLTPGSASFAYADNFPSWTLTGLVRTTEINPDLLSRYPKLICYLAQGTDFLFANPATADPLVLGTFQYQVADEGCIQWLVDGLNTGALTTQFSSFYFDGPGEVCDTVPCPSVGDPLAIDDVTPACPVADATKNVPYPAGTIFTATGGTTPYTWSATGLPTGMTIGASTGELGGTPTAPGGFPFTVIADGAAGGHDERACSLFVREYGVTVVLASADTMFTPELDTIVHSFQVTNTGNVDDTYDLQAWSSGGFTVEIFGTSNPLFLPVGNSSSVQVRHIVPDVACPITGIHVWDRAFLAAASQTIAAVADTAFADIAIFFEAGVDVADFPNGICGTPGGVKNVDFSVENLGACPDTFDLQPHVSHIDWSVVLPGGLFLVLGPGASQNVTVEVGIPADALCTDVEIVSLTATGRQYEATDSDSVNECVSAVLDGTLSDENNQVGAPGDTLAYCFTATNTGNCDGNFFILGQSGWEVIVLSGPQAEFPLAIGADSTLCLGVIVPPGASDGDTDTLCAFFEAVQDDFNLQGNYLDSTCVVSTVGIPCESSVDVVHTGNVGCSYPGLTVQDTFTVQNTGNCADVFDLTADVDLAGWLAEIVGSSSVALDPQQTAAVYVDVTIPSSALCTDLAELALSADGQTYGATDSDAGPICVYPVQDGTLSDESNQNGNPGDTAWYYFTITNTGNCPTSYFASFGALWPTTTMGEAEVLDPGDTAIVAVGHVVPEAAEDGDKDTLCAFLTTFLEKNGPYLDTSCVVTTAIASCVGGVDVTGDTYLSGGPGDTLYADFMVQNTGSGPDRFLLATQSDLGWPVSIVGSDTTDLLGPGSSDNVEVRVIIPNDASCEALDRVDLDAFSLCDPSVWDRATVEIGVDPVCAVSVVAHTEDSTGAPGQTMRYYFDIANEGNCGFQYEILVYQSPTWDTAYAITSPVQIPDGGEVTVFVDVTIPGGAQPGDEHTLTVCGSCYYDNPRISVAKRVELACDSTITRVPTGCEADQPILSLGGYQTINYGGPSGLWEVQVALKNNGPGKAEAIAAEMHHDVAWLLIPDPVCSYPDLTPGASSYGYDSYTFDLQNYPGGSFNVWFDVTYTDSCGNPYQVRLDPTFRDPAEGGVPVPASHFALHQNVPNPFNPETSITFELSSGGNTELMIYNAAGQLVKTLWQGSLPTGHHTFLWNGESDRGTSVPSGSYFYSLRNGGLTETRRMVLVR